MFRPSRNPVRSTTERPVRSIGVAMLLALALGLALQAGADPIGAAAGADSPRAAAGPDTASGAGVAAAAAQAISGAAATAPPARPAKTFGHWETGKGLFENTCLPCHGAAADGNPAIGAPALNMQEPWYLLVQLRKFRAGIRGAKEDDIGGQMMAPMAQSLPDEQSLLDVAVYVASLEGPPPARTLHGDMAAGEKTFKMICTACHGVNGVGRPEIRTPALMGQADWYIAGQLRKFRKGLRGYHDEDVSGMQMRGMAAALGNEKAIVDVATYIASLAK